MWHPDTQLHEAMRSLWGENPDASARHPRLRKQSRARRCWETAGSRLSPALRLTPPPRASPSWLPVGRLLCLPALPIHAGRRSFTAHSLSASWIQGLGLSQVSLCPHFPVPRQVGDDTHTAGAKLGQTSVMEGQAVGAPPQAGCLLQHPPVCCRCPVPSPQDVEPQLGRRAAPGVGLSPASCLAPRGSQPPK